jgi:hypothetical protein
MIEGSKHYINSDKYDHRQHSNSLVYSKRKLHEKKLLALGILTWHINRNYLNLVEAFKTQNSKRIIQLSADLGHYVRICPLHTTSNYTGQ